MNRAVGCGCSEAGRISRKKPSRATATVSARLPDPAFACAAEREYSERHDRGAARSTPRGNPGENHSHRPPAGVDVIGEGEKDLASSPGIPSSRAPSHGIRIRRDGGRADLGSRPPKHRRDALAFFGNNNQLLRPGIGRITEWNRASDPPPLRLQVRPRFRNPRRRHFPFELRERGQHIQHEIVERGHAECWCGDHVQFDIAGPEFLSEENEVPKAA